MSEQSVKEKKISKKGKVIFTGTAKVNVRPGKVKVHVRDAGSTEVSSTDVYRSANAQKQIKVLKNLEKKLEKNLEEKLEDLEKEKRHLKKLLEKKKQLEAL